jgi:type I restriction enzyme S subunit
MSFSEWQSFPIGSLCAAIYDGPHATPKKTIDGPVFLGISSLSNGRIDLSGTEHLSEEDFIKWTRRVTPQPNDLVFSYETRLGEAALIPDGLRCCLGRRMGLLRFDTRKVVPKFMLYAYLGPEFQQTISSRTVHGSTVDRIPLMELPNFPISIPSLPTQHRIADILSALDEKIELNHRTNATIESVTRALFKSWFLDFEPVYLKSNGETSIGITAEIANLFPDKFIDTELGEIPASWEVKSVGELAERVSMGPFGSSIKVETFVDDGIPIISGPHLRGFMLEDSKFNFITRDHAEKLIKANVYPGDVIFTHAGNIGNLAFIPETSEYRRYVVSQRQFFIRCNLGKITPSFITYYFQSPEGQHKLLANSSSVGVPSIAQPVTYLKSIKLPAPPREILEAFEQIVTPLHRKYAENTKESRTLETIRDTLSPKLMSGEIEL